MPPARKRAASASAKKPASAEKKSKGDAPMTAEQEAMAKAKANAAARRQANEDKKATEAESKKSVVAPAKPAAKSRSRAASSPSPVRAETPEQVAKDAAKANATSRKRASTSTAKPAKPAASSRRSSRAAPIELSSDEDEEEEELVVKPARGRASTSTTSPAPKSGASTTAHTARTQSSVSPMKKAPVASPKPVPVRVNAAAAIGRRGASMSPQPPARPPSRGSNNANAPYAGSAAGGSRPSTGTTRSPTPSAKGNKPESPTSAAKRIAAQNAAERRLQDAYEAETIQQEDRGRASNNQGDLTAEQEAVRQAKVMSEERRRKNNRASSAGPSDRSSGNLNSEEEEEPKVDTWNRGVFDQDNAPFWVEHMDALSVGLVALVICSVVYFHSSDVTAAISGSTASVAKTVAGPVNKLMYLLIILFPIVYMATVQGWWNYLLGLLNGLNVDPADAEREHSRFRAEQYQNQTFQSQSQPPAQSVSPVRNRAKSPSVSGRQSQPYSYSASGRREVPGELRSDHTSSSSSSSAEAARTSSSTNSNTPAASFLANLSWKQKIIAAALSACAVLFSIAYYKIQYEMYMDSALYSLGAVAIIGALIFTYIYSSKSQQNELVLELSKYIKTRTRNTHESVPIEHLMWNIKDFADDKKWPADTPSALTTLTSSEIHGLWEPAVAIVKTDVRFRITQDTSTGRKMEHIQFTGPRNKPPGNITRPTFASTGSSYSFSANANPGHQSFQRF